MIPLKSVMDAPDFRAALRPIGRSFRDALGLPLDVDEIGIVFGGPLVIMLFFVVTRGINRGESSIESLQVGIFFSHGHTCVVAQPGIPIFTQMCIEFDKLKREPSRSARG